MNSSSINCDINGYSDDERYVVTFLVKIWDFYAAETVRLALHRKGIKVEIDDILPLPMQWV
jgi:hypothetical protein